MNANQINFKQLKVFYELNRIGEIAITVVIIESFGIYEALPVFQRVSNPIIICQTSSYASFAWIFHVHGKQFSPCYVSVWIRKTNIAWQNFMTKTNNKIESKQFSIKCCDVSRFSFLILHIPFRSLLSKISLLFTLLLSSLNYFSFFYF